MPTCSICSEVLGADLSAAICGHVYHTGCITNWLNQKPSCPLCKHKLTRQHLTPLHFAPKHKLTQLQQQHLQAANAGTAASSSSSSSPFTLQLRLQALRAHLDDLDLRLEQSTERLTAVTSELGTLDDTYRTVASEWEAVSVQEQRAVDELATQQLALTAKRYALQQLHRQHRAAYRQLLALRTLPTLRRRRAASTTDIHHTDLAILVQQTEATLPTTSFNNARDDTRTALRDEALCVVLRVAVAEVKAELEQLNGQAAGMKGARKRVTELQREEERLQRELDKTKQQVVELEQHKAELLKRESRVHLAASSTACDTAAQETEEAEEAEEALHEVRRTSTSDVNASSVRKRKLSQLSAPSRVDSRAEDDVIVLSD